ncbi:hypothetical protein M9458_007827, partial [Cirrhinus mrigala]
EDEMLIKECCACGGPVELPDAHDAYVFCLGRAHAEAALDGNDSQNPPGQGFCNPKLHASQNPRQPRAEGPSDECMSTQFLHAHHSKEPPVSFTKASLRHLDDARDLNDLDDDDDAISTAASGSGDWSVCLKCASPWPRLTRSWIWVLIGLDWLPSKPCHTTSHIADKASMAAGQAASAIHTMAVLQAFQVKMLQTLDEEGPGSAAFKKLRSATDLALRATKKTAQGIGRCMGSLVTLQSHLWLTLTDMRESEKAQLLDAPISRSACSGMLWAHSLRIKGDEPFPTEERSVRCTPTTFQILFFAASKKARKTAAYSFLGSEGGPGASHEAKSEAVPLPKEDGTTPFQFGTRSTAT